MDIAMSYTKFWKTFLVIRILVAAKRLRWIRVEKNLYHVCFKTVKLYMQDWKQKEWISDHDKVQSTQPRFEKMYCCIDYLKQENVRTIDYRTYIFKVAHSVSFENFYLVMF
jgi:hypothetical protein